MPVEGFPDPDKHKICCKCGKWFEPHEGSPVTPPKAGPVAQIGRTLAGVEGFGLTERFMCHACQGAQRRGRLAVWVFLLIGALALIALVAFGLLDWLWSIQRMR